MKIDHTHTLLMGEPGIGKSELSLELLDRGHLLIADDIISLNRKHDAIFAKAPTSLQSSLHIRGLGILNYKQLYPNNIIDQDIFPLQLIIQLNDKKNQDSSITPQQSEKIILGVRIPVLTLSIYKRINLALLIETLIRNFQFNHTSPPLTLSDSIQFIQEPTLI